MLWHQLGEAGLLLPLQLEFAPSAFPHERCHSQHMESLHARKPQLEEKCPDTLKPQEKPRYFFSSVKFFLAWAIPCGTRYHTDVLMKDYIDRAACHIGCQQCCSQALLPSLGSQSRLTPPVCSWGGPLPSFSPQHLLSCCRGPPLHPTWLQWGSWKWLESMTPLQETRVWRT